MATNQRRRQSPESTPEPSPVVKRVAPRKRQYVASDDDEDGQINRSPVASSSTSRLKRSAHARIMDSDDEEPRARSDVEVNDSQDSHHRHAVQPRLIHTQHEERANKPQESRFTKTGQGKGKGGPKRSSNHDASGSSSRPPAKKPKRSKRATPEFSASEDEDFQADFDEDDEEEMRAVTEEDLTEDDEEEYASRNKKAAAKGKNKIIIRGGKAKPPPAGSRNRKAGSTDTMPRFKNEGRIAAANAASAVDPLKLDDMDVDIMDDDRHPPSSAALSSAPPTSAKDITTSPSSHHGSVGKDDSVTPTVQKRRKLPPIKKNKIVIPPSESTTSGIVAESSTKSILDEIAPASASVARLPAALQGVNDVDLLNKDTYNALFKGLGGAMGSDRKAKEAERKRELQAMKEEWKAKRATEQTAAFDLQSQYDKISQFEERLRSAHSGALYPHYVGGKLRELWERSRAREYREQKERSNESQPYVNG